MVPVDANGVPFRGGFFACTFDKPILRGAADVASFTRHADIDAFQRLDEPACVCARKATALWQGRRACSGKRFVGHTRYSMPGAFVTKCVGDCNRFCGRIADAMCALVFAVPFPAQIAHRPGLPAGHPEICPWDAGAADSDFDRVSNGLGRTRQGGFKGVSRNVLHGISTGKNAERIVRTNRREPVAAGLFKETG